MKCAILALIALLAAYEPSRAEPPVYEVAAIKPSTNDAPLAFRIEPDGTIAATGITLKRLMMTAYSVQGFRIAGGPGWVTSKSWDVQARPNRAAAPDEVQQMLRMLLEDRFRLHSHSEKRMLPVYELVVDGKGAKVPRVTAGNVGRAVRVSPGLIQLTKATPATFASQLSYALARPVVDKTYLSGEFDFELEWTPETGEDGGPISAGLPPGTKEPPASTADRGSVFSAIREQLGLRLKSARGPVEMIVIDSVQAPTAN